jgi:hypothetical protein
LVAAVLERAPDAPPAIGLRGCLWDVTFPNDFFRFGLSEHGRFPMQLCGESLGLCLLTGKTVDRVREDVWKHAEEWGGLTVVLELIGDPASATFVVSTTFRMKVRVRGLYFDDAGAEDVGLMGGRLLSLRSGEISRLGQCVLSGDWVGQLRMETLVDCNKRMNHDPNDAALRCNCA